MADVHDKATRSYNMSRIRSKNTEPELIVRSFLYKNGFRFRLHDKKLPGKPDIVLKKYRTVIFVHGCFWHGHKGCEYFVVPKTRTDWWIKKINRNKHLDRVNILKLRNGNWKVFSIFECDLMIKKQTKTLSKLLNRLR